MEVTRVYTYFWDSNTQFSLNLPTEPSSAYTVTLLDDISSRDGEALGQETTIGWQTARLWPGINAACPQFRSGQHLQRLHAHPGLRVGAQSGRG